MEMVVLELLNLPEKDRLSRLAWIKFNPNLYAEVIKQMQELQTMQEDKIYNCWVCNKPIISERAEFLIEEGVREDSLTCVTHSQTKRLQALYSGEHGTSDLILCDKVYNDSVRAKFHEAEEETSESSASEIDDG